MTSKNSAQKAARVAQRKAERNKPIRSSVKTYITKARRLILANDLDAAQEAVKQAVIALDKAAQKGVLHPNNAARRKSRLMKRINAALAASQPATPPEATPQKATPQKATPQKATPQEATPQEATPQEATPQEATPQEATPQKATPQKATPQKATPKRKTKSKG